MRNDLFEKLPHWLNRLGVDCATPPGLVRRVLEFYDGAIDLDPCGMGFGRPEPIPAQHVMAPPKCNGLFEPWIAEKIYCFPPYTRKAAAWPLKAASEHRRRGCEVLLLMPSKTDTRWFACLSGYARVYFRGRLRFEPHRTPARCASVLFYLGPRVEHFRAVFGSYGSAESGSPVPHRGVALAAGAETNVSAPEARREGTPCRIC